MHPCHRFQATQEVVSKLPLTTEAEFNAAVQAAKDAFPAWRATPVPVRQRVMLKFQELIRANWVSCKAAQLQQLSFYQLAAMALLAQLCRAQRSWYMLLDLQLAD